eukprot:TRINITY_DN6952_c0_g1_i1.p1 TRINITY_DN6952_c0_g1~~TRINITY_DN6952_c0_g1_i1.p1  ORF type:complete len:155 (+),score=36.91 TRINITY_DN6952_c0_g1_i1:80-544(+)
MPGIAMDVETHEQHEEDFEENGEEHADKKRFVVRFRNYTPRDESLKAHVMEKPRVYSISKEIAEKLEMIAEEDPDLTVLTIAPKKANWDLKRDLEPKLRKLETRTQRAIIEMLREKLKAEEAERQGAGSDDMNRNVSMAIADTLASEEAEDDED